ncbi:MAG: ankyrin repeat domain-containing protein [Rickettsiaceae bacterium]|nr:ankyrin repeat domain-containing protein [Rickettsiaceae bacterium]
MKEKQESSDFDTILFDTILFNLVEYRNLSALRDFLSNPGVDINATNGMGYTALTIALERGYEEIVQLLLERGATLETTEEVARIDVTLPGSMAINDNDDWLNEEVGATEEEWDMVDKQFRAQEEGGAAVAEEVVRGVASMAIDDGDSAAVDFAPQGSMAINDTNDWLNEEVEANEEEWDMVDKQFRTQEEGGAAVTEEIVRDVASMAIDDGDSAAVDFAPPAPVAIDDIQGGSGKSSGSAFPFGAAAIVAAVVAVPVVAGAIATVDGDTIRAIAGDVVNRLEDMAEITVEAVGCMLGVNSACGGSML